MTRGCSVPALKSACLAIASIALPLPAGAAPAVPNVQSRFRDPAMPVLVVAHRACHTPAPRSGQFSSNPENSLPGIRRCITLGVDMAEVDVRRTRDGYLVLMHDPTVDRTTDGHGAVDSLTLAEIRRLRLRENEGGPDAPLTDARVPTLQEALSVAKGRILLNLDVQAGLYADVVAAVLKAGRRDGVIIKEPAGIGSPVLADIAPFDSVPFMPIPRSGGGGRDLPAILTAQLSGHRKPIAFELPRMSPESLPELSRIAHAAGVRLWVNTLWTGFVSGYGGDEDALRDPDRVWGRLRRAGISVFQTDEPEALLRYLGRAR